MGESNVNPGYIQRDETTTKAFLTDPLSRITLTVKHIAPGSTELEMYPFDA